MNISVRHLYHHVMDEIDSHGMGTEEALAALHLVMEELGDRIKEEEVYAQV